MRKERGEEERGEGRGVTNLVHKELATLVAKAADDFHNPPEIADVKDGLDQVDMTKVSWAVQIGALAGGTPVKAICRSEARIHQSAPREKNGKNEIDERGMKKEGS